jgi:hypothetical protein
MRRIQGYPTNQNRMSRVNRRKRPSQHVQETALSAVASGESDRVAARGLGRKRSKRIHGHRCVTERPAAFLEWRNGVARGEAHATPSF